MQHFFRVGDTNTQPLLHAIQRQPELWDQNKLRTTFPGSPHNEVHDIFLWFNAPDSKDVANDRETVPFPAWEKLPQAREIVFNLMRAVEGVRLGRVLITKLEPGKQITPHQDAGAPVEFYKRYQVALQSLPGAMFTIGNETVNFATSDVWLINNKEIHSVKNNSKDDRIVLIVDIATG